LYPENIGGQSLLPIVAGEKRKLVLPMNVILKDIRKIICGFLPHWVST
jgi:hypothetical protein